LQQLDAKRNYAGKLKDQINKVINNFQSKDELKLNKNDKKISKIEIIEVISNSINNGYQMGRKKSRSSLKII
jgi:hypothetical protein